ncbi:hypothetical protein B0A48_06011 [Cryoendolithus antarcticus]|uniref:C2H2-type domain-containing protein n=1 Tax=Cryoendolithus antarcticus TaxID=1507870 RepID=A0A1V8TCL8_9PEZI|nr:hypothetical protein B0A48_06011 [Cryoendolithus antarcticus]
MSSSRGSSTDSSQSTLTGATDAKETRRDSAYATSPTLDTWRSEQDRSTAFAARGYRFASGPEGVPRHCPTLPADERSVARAFDAQLTILSSDGESVPSLDMQSRTISASFIERLAAESAARDGGLDEEGRVIAYGLASTQAPTGIICLFDFLGCAKVSKSMARWNDHSKSHLKNQSPPTEMKCPVRACGQTFQAEDGEVTWSDRWSHIKNSHDLEEMADMPSSLDAAMIQHLYNKGIIDRAGMKELRTHGGLGVDRAGVVSSHSESSNRRREGGEPRSGRARK